MAGSGVVDVVDNVGDRDGTPVWRLTLQDGPGNAAARQELWTNATVKATFEPHVAVDMPQHGYPICPIKAGDPISWDAHHIVAAGIRYPKVGFEFDPDAPLSPP